MGAITCGLRQPALRARAAQALAGAKAEWIDTAQLKLELGAKLAALDALNRRRLGLERDGQDQPPVPRDHDPDAARLTPVVVNRGMRLADHRGMRLQSCCGHVWLLAALSMSAAGCGGVGADEETDGGGDPIDPDECSIAIDEDRVVDLEVPTVRITGRVTWNGAPLPEYAGDTNSAPSLLLTGSMTGEAGTLVRLSAVAQTGGTYSVVVVPGEYTLTYTRTLWAQCDTIFPCQQGVSIQTGIELLEDGTLDIDLTPVRLSGEIRYNGAAIDGTGRGGFQLNGADGSIGPIRLSSLSPGTAYDVPVFPGDYSISYVPDALSCGPSFPCQVHTIIGCAPEPQP